MNKKDYKALLVIFVMMSIIIIILTKGDYVYGSEIDWVTQHYRIPEYFRNLFYETHNLFPNFAFHLGAGQNIYYVSYYGLFSPIILLSYLLPFVSMQNYIIASTIISLFISIFLFYKWIRKKNDMRTTVILTCLFSLATPLLFHSHRHIMFMNYMPFLLISLFGVDTYFEKGKKITLIIGTFLMIMTSYYFSVPGIMAIIIYGIMNYIDIKPNRNIKEYIKDGVKFLGPILLSILMTSILLLPTFYTILQGRVEGNHINISELLLPNFDISNILYGGYSLGLTSIFILSFIIGFKTKKPSIKFLSFVLLIITCIPLSLYILNGGMYINGKVLIPFLPLALLLIANVLKENCITKKDVILFTIVSVIIVIMNYNEDTVYLFIIDVLLTILSIVVQNKKHWNFVLPAITILLALGIMIWSNEKDKLVKENNYVYENVLNYIEEDTSIYRTNNLYNNLHSINQILKDDFYTTSIYSSTSNPYYKNFYKNSINNEFRYRSREIMSTTKNVLSNIYLGNKYIVADAYEGLGYEKIYSDQVNVYKNENVFSIGYATDKVMSQREYQALDYPYDIDALLHYTIVDTDIENVYEPTISKIDLDLDITKSEVEYKKQENGYYITSSKNQSKMNIEIKNKEKLKGKILLIRCKINDESNIDRSIDINGITNKITEKEWKYHNENYTFEFTISENNLSALELTFSKGNFDLQDIEFYILDNQDLLSIQDTHDEYVIEKIYGDTIEGNINVTENGYFSISIPYDEGFTIYLDHEKINYEKVNDNFIGFSITEGKHEIQIVYKAPWSRVGKILSICGFMLFSILVIVEKKKVDKLFIKKNNSENNILQSKN